MSRVVQSTVDQAVSSSSGWLRPASCEEDQQVLQHTAGKSDGCSSDVLTDTDSYQTADDDDQRVSPGLDDADVDPLTGTVRATELRCPADQQQDSSEEDDIADCRKQRGCQSEPEKRRRSYQFAVAKSGRLILDTNDDDVVCDLDPVEFHHRPFYKCRAGSDRRSEDVPCDLDPREFSHPSMQTTQSTMVDSNIVVKHTTSTIEDIKSMTDERMQSNSEVFEDDPRKWPSEALSLLSKGHSEVCVTERHESIVEGNVLPSIVILSPTVKTFVTDHREWIVRQSTKRAMFDFSLVADQLPSFTAVRNVDKISNQTSTSFLYGDSPEDEHFSTRLSNTDKNKESLPIVEAEVHESTELIYARLIETAALWDPFVYDDANLSSSPEKVFEGSVPFPDYDSSPSSSEAEADITADDDIYSDTAPFRADRSPTPDYDVLSPICEQDMEFHFDDDEQPEPELSAEVHSRFTDVEVGDDDAATLEPAFTKVDEDENTENKRKDADISYASELTQTGELTQCSTGYYGAQGQYSSVVESAPVVIAANKLGMLSQSQSKAHTSAADQSSLYSSLGSSSDKRRRTGKRSVTPFCSKCVICIYSSLLYLITDIFFNLWFKI